MRLSVGALGARVPRIFRFCAVGAINTGVYYGLYALFRQVCFYLLAHVVAFLAAMVLSYFLNCYFTFRIRPTLRKFLLFPLSNATNLLAQTAGLSLLVGAVGMNPEYAPLPAAVVAIPMTFVVARFVLAAGRTTSAWPERFAAAE